MTSTMVSRAATNGSSSSVAVAPPESPIAGGDESASPRAAETEKGEADASSIALVIPYYNLAENPWMAENLRTVVGRWQRGCRALYVIVVELVLEGQKYAFHRGAGDESPPDSSPHGSATTPSSLALECDLLLQIEVADWMSYKEFAINAARRKIPKSRTIVCWCDSDVFLEECECEGAWVTKLTNLFAASPSSSAHTLVHLFSTMRHTTLFSRDPWLLSDEKATAPEATEDTATSVSATEATNAARVISHAAAMAAAEAATGAQAAATAAASPAAATASARRRVRQARRRGTANRGEDLDEIGTLVRSFEEEHETTSLSALAGRATTAPPPRRSNGVKPLIVVFFSRLTIPFALVGGGSDLNQTCGRNNM